MNSPPGQEPRFPDHPLLSAIQPAPRLFDPAPPVFDDDDDDGDIYRGEPSPEDGTSISSSSSGSSSSSSERYGGRLGAIAAVVEHAVSRWARRVRRGSDAGSTNSSSSSNTSSSSSSSSSSSNSASSINTLARMSKRRLWRRSSQASLQTIQSERDILARIGRLKALEESRQIPRRFGLYLPPTPGPLAPLTEGNEASAKRRVLSTTSMSLTINHLDAMMRISRNRKARGRSKDPFEASRSTPIKHRRSHRSLRFSAFAAPKNNKKGKRRANRHSRAAQGTIPPAPPSSQLMPKAWFLDVASPTWEDLRALGKLLHIHPLTLEDILQQDPREKLELFPKLGYYFISFRAIETTAERTRMQKEARKLAETTGNDPDAVDVPFGEANVYLAVFNDGICCFHYRDISDHLDRVRNRIVLLDEIINMSSDWIAHGIIDSIVDSFFPFLAEIEKEVMDIDTLVYADGESIVEEVTQEDTTSDPQTPSTLKVDLPSSDEPEEKGEKEEKETPPTEAEKRPSQDSVSSQSQESIRPHFTAPRPTFRMLLRRTRRYVSSLWRRIFRRAPLHVPDSRSKTNPRTTTLRRMAKTRRLVTSLGRSLAGKNEVMTQIRKRLLQGGLEPTLGNGGSKNEELEVAIYMGDVHDHILTLQHSLTHIERMLSHSHPSYLSHLRVAVARTKGGSDMAILYLTVISIAVLCCQGVTGSFSMNLHSPRNKHAAGHPFNVFYIVVSLVGVVLTTYLNVVYYWWRTAKRKRGAMLRKDTTFDYTPQQTIVTAKGTS